MRERRPRDSWLYDDLLAWLSPGGLLLTALALRFPEGLHALRAQAPELTLPTWFAGAYALGLALSPLGRIVYAVAQAIVWPLLREAWSMPIRALSERLERDEGLRLSDPARMGSGEFHDVDRRLREYIEAMDPDARAVMNRMKVLCSLACNSAAACLVFVTVDALAGRAPTWTLPQIAVTLAILLLALVAAVYRERRRQRTQLSIWRRLRIGGGGDAAP
ncbi:MAG: hypothetical protein ACOY82_20445 [Pseudomonadota bacterium]